MAFRSLPANPAFDGCFLLFNESSVAMCWRTAIQRTTCSLVLKFEIHDQCVDVKSKRRLSMSCWWRPAQARWNGRRWPMASSAG
jgi:hypothetical protein